MARTVRNPKLDSRSARSSLALRREPYWTPLAPGCALGYRKGRIGGTWIARRYDAAATPPRSFQTLGPADDVLDPDGIAALSFGQAQEKARLWCAGEAHRNRHGEVSTGGPYTVGRALDDYLGRLAAEGRASLGVARSHAAMIRPALGRIALTELSAARLRRWLEATAASPRRVRTGKGAATRFLAAPENPEAQRARRATANRIWTTLRAALNQAFAEAKVPSDTAWRRVRPFRGTDAARLRFLTVAEAQRLINAAPGPFRALVTAALLTGARYGELGALEVGDFHADAGTLFVRRSKAGRPRHVYLTDEGHRFFEQLAAGRPASAPLLERNAGERWQPYDQARPMRAAVVAARIDPPIGFHGLRHTYASLAVMNGAPLQVVAQNLGHSTTRMVERHYGHLTPSYVADTIRRAAPKFGLERDAALQPFQLQARRT